MRLVKNTTLRLVKKTFLVILDWLKSTCPKKPKWFFDPLSLWFNNVCWTKVEVTSYFLMPLLPQSHWYAKCGWIVAHLILVRYSILTVNNKSYTVENPQGSFFLYWVCNSTNLGDCGISNWGKKCFQYYKYLHKPMMFLLEHG